MSYPVPPPANPQPAGAEATESGADYLAEAFAALGVSHFFHVPVIFPKAIRAMQARGIQPVINHSEKAAAYMADGYARVSGRLGVCGAQAIGAANLSAGLLDAYMVRSPVLAITGGGSAATRDRNQYQEVDQRPLFSGVTKMDGRVELVSRLPDMLGQAMRVATTGAPGPTHLELAGFMGTIVDEALPPSPLPEAKYGAYPAIRQPAPAEDVEKAAKALAASKKPIVVAGSGVRAGRAHAELADFCRKLQLPLATSLDAKAVLPESDPLSIGVIGTYSRDCAQMAVTEADLVLFVATTTGSMVTFDWRIPKPGVPAIQIDVDPRELGRNYPLLAGLAGDPATVLGQLADAAGAQPDRSAWLARIAALKAEWAASVQALETSEAAPIRPERLCRTLSDVLPENALVVVDTGYAAAWAVRHIYLDKPGQGLLRAGGSLGWAYPASIGAKLGAPDRQVVCFTGDGGFLYHLPELETAMRYGVHTVTVVNNNNGFGQEGSIWGQDPELAHNWLFAPVSYAKLAEAFGAKAYRVDRPEDLAPALVAALAETGPVVVEVMTDIAARTPPAWKP